MGPLVKSKIASAFGFGVSLLERLMANPLYSRQDWGYNPKLVSVLHKGVYAVEHFLVVFCRNASYYNV